MPALKSLRHVSAKLFKYGALSTDQSLPALYDIILYIYTPLVSLQFLLWYYGVGLVAPSVVPSSLPMELLISCWWSNRVRCWWICFSTTSCMITGGVTGCSTGVPSPGVPHQWNHRPLYCLIVFDSIAALIAASCAHCAADDLCNKRRGNVSTFIKDLLCSTPSMYTIFKVLHYRCIVSCSFT